MTNIPVSLSPGPAPGVCGGVRGAAGDRGAARNAVYLRGTTANQFSFYYRTNNASLQLLDLCSCCLLYSLTFCDRNMYWLRCSTLETCLGHFL